MFTDSHRVLCLLGAMRHLMTEIMQLSLLHKGLGAAYIAAHERACQLMLSSANNINLFKKHFVI
jgi:hypothetical protein